MRLAVTTLACVLFGCSGADFQTGSVTDGSVVDGATDSVIDTGTPLDTGGTTDTGTAVDTGGTADTGTATDAPSTPCQPFWCGCGTCVPKDIACTHDTSLGCPLGCASAPCPAAEDKSTCTNVGDRCQRNGIDGDIACYHTADCPPGKCCKGAVSPPTHGTCVSAPDPTCGP